MKPHRHIGPGALVAGLLAGFATPGMAAGDYPFFSLANTDLIVLAAFIIFVGVLVYFKVPTIVTGLLDKRADEIRAELDEARRLREEAIELRASFERKQVEVKDQAARIVERAREDAKIAAEQAKADIAASIERRLKAAEDKIASAEAAALREVRNRAASIAVAAAGDLIAKALSDTDSDALIAESVAAVEQRLH